MHPSQGLTSTFLYTIPRRAPYLLTVWYIEGKLRCGSLLKRHFYVIVTTHWMTPIVTTHSMTPMGVLNC